MFKIKMRGNLVVIVGLIFVCIGTALADQPDEGNGDSDSCVVVLHYYFATPGKEKEVISTRIEGNRVRATLGLPISRLLVLESSSSGHPSKGGLKPGNASYLMSETVFRNDAEKAHSEEMLLGSEDYLAVRKRMGSLLDHFEASVRRSLDGKCQ